jgi:hypothetical protein
VERFILGELPKEELREIEEMRSRDPELEAKIREIERSNAEILSAYPVDETVRRIEKRARLEEAGQAAREAASQQAGAEEAPRQDGAEEAPDSGRRTAGNRGIRDEHGEQGRQGEDGGKRPRIIPFAGSIPRFALPVAAAAAVALFFIFSQQLQLFDTGARAPVSHDQPGVRLKGADPGIYVFRKSGETADPLSPGARADEGDLLQLGYVAPGADYGVLFSVDGRGTVTLHFPPSPDGSTEIEQGGVVMLEASYRLDDAPDYERFYLVTSEQSLEAGRILREVRRTIGTTGELPASREELERRDTPLIPAEGELKWYVFELKK